MRKKCWFKLMQIIMRIMSNITMLGFKSFFHFQALSTNELIKHKQHKRKTFKSAGNIFIKLQIDFHRLNSFFLSSTKWNWKTCETVKIKKEFSSFLSALENLFKADWEIPINL